jgi:hypothetical protein
MAQDDRVESGQIDPEGSGILEKGRGLSRIEEQFD